MLWLSVLCGVLLVTVAALGLKISSLKRAAEEIRREFEEKLTVDTNTLISVSTGDPSMRRLAADVNRELKELRRLRHRFVQGDLELKNGVTGISHDLRTPLTAISGYLELLEKEEKSETVEKYLAIIRDRTENMKALTEELFRYSVITSPDYSAPAEETDVRAVLEESILSLRAALEQKGIAPEIYLTDRRVMRTLNRAALRRVFENLLQNAVKYSAGDLRISMTADGEIFFENSAPDLTEVQVERLFDRFYTVDNARHSTGLGLAIARTLIRQLGGELSAEYRQERLILKVFLQKSTVPEAVCQKE